jgi:N-acetylglucosamine kinase-like BadF-type ATPase
MRSFDAQRETVLLERICSVWNLKSRDELVRFANSTPAPRFSDLFPMIETTADDGYAVAREVLESAGNELAALVEMVIRRLWHHADLVPIGVSGGVLANSDFVRRAFHRALNALPYKCSVSFEINDPVMGALWMARRGAQAQGAS